MVTRFHYTLVSQILSWTPSKTPCSITTSEAWMSPRSEGGHVTWLHWTIRPSHLGFNSTTKIFKAIGELSGGLHGSCEAKWARRGFEKVPLKEGHQERPHGEDAQAMHGSAMRRGHKIWKVETNKYLGRWFNK